jgi:hypothetical protein
VTEEDVAISAFSGTFGARNFGQIMLINYLDILLCI